MVAIGFNAWGRRRSERMGKQTSVRRGIDYTITVPQECIDDGPNRDQVSCRSPFVVEQKRRAHGRSTAGTNETFETFKRGSDDARTGTGSAKERTAQLPAT
jgi:hypothetical protein